MDIKDFEDSELIDELTYRGYEIDPEVSDFDTNDLIDELEFRGFTILDNGKEHSTSADSLIVKAFEAFHRGEDEVGLAYSKQFVANAMGRIL